MTDRQLYELAPAKRRTLARAQRAAGRWAGSGGRVGAAGGQVGGGLEGGGCGAAAGVAGGGRAARRWAVTAGCDGVQRSVHARMAEPGGPDPRGRTVVGVCGEGRRGWVARGRLGANSRGLRSSEEVQPGRGARGSEIRGAASREV